MTRLGCQQYDIKEVGFIIENRENVLNTEFNELSDLLEKYPADRLKLMFLFRCASLRADFDNDDKPKIKKAIENEAMKYKKLASMIG
jgi:hypothetical protein